MRKSLSRFGGSIFVIAAISVLVEARTGPQPESPCALISFQTALATVFTKVLNRASISTAEVAG
jgi:hypothetical protein